MAAAHHEKQQQQKGYCTNKGITPDERKLLSAIRAMPGLYIGSKSLVSLRHFIGGYSSAMHLLGITAEHRIIPQEFQPFVAGKYGIFTETQKNYFTLILENSPDEQQAFDLFFSLLDQYLSSVGADPVPMWNPSTNSLPK